MLLIEYVPTCDCGAVDGKKVILNTQAHVGVITAIGEDGVFADNKALYLPNRFCPNCGAKRREKILNGDEQLTLF